MIRLMIIWVLLFLPMGKGAWCGVLENISGSPALYQFMQTLEHAVEQGPDFQQFTYREVALSMPKDVRELSNADVRVIEGHLSSIYEQSVLWCRPETRVQLMLLLSDAVHDLRVLLGARIFARYEHEVVTRYDITFVTYYVSPDYQLVFTETTSR